MSHINRSRAQDALVCLWFLALINQFYPASSSRYCRHLWVLLDTVLCKITVGQVAEQVLPVEEDTLSHVIVPTEMHTVWTQWVVIVVWYEIIKYQSCCLLGKKVPWLRRFIFRDHTPKLAGRREPRAIHMCLRYHFCVQNVFSCCIF